MTARPATHADAADLATRIHGSVDPIAHPSHPTIHTDSGRVHLGLRGWHLYRPGRVEPPLGRWDASAEDIAAAFFEATKKVAA